jgi:hypothetical protein
MRAYRLLTCLALALAGLVGSVSSVPAISLCTTVAKNVDFNGSFYDVSCNLPKGCFCRATFCPRSCSGPTGLPFPCGQYLVSEYCTAKFAKRR